MREINCGALKLFIYGIFMLEKVLENVKNALNDGKDETQKHIKLVKKKHATI